MFQQMDKYNIRGSNLKTSFPFITYDIYVDCPKL
jgi:hypothetical protein